MIDIKRIQAIIGKHLNAAHKELSAMISESGADGSLGSGLILLAVHYSHRARVPEHAIRSWFEEWVINVYRRGVNVQEYLDSNPKDKPS